MTLTSVRVYFSSMNKPLIYSETQRFNQWWIWLIYLLLCGLTLFMAISQFVFDRPVGNVPASDGQMLAIVLLMLFLIAFFASCHLKTMIYPSEIHVRLYPFHLRYRVLKSEDIEQMTIETYKPISEFGGWGLRYGRGGMAYNVSGNIGLRLLFRNQKRLLIGAKNPEELREALKKAGFRIT